MPAYLPCIISAMMTLPSSSNISSSLTLSHNSSYETLMENYIQSAQRIIHKCNPMITPSTSITSTTSPSLLLSHRKETGGLIECVHNLRNAMQFYLAQNTTSPKLSLSHSLTQAAMQILDKEFRNILVSLSSSPSELIKDELTLNKAATSVLKMIADCMIRGGYGKECAKAYKTVRKSFIEEEFKRIIIGHTQRPRSSFKVIKSTTKTDDGVSEQRIISWIKAMNTCVKVFYKERILCDRVFSASETIKESCFAETTKDSAVTLFTSGQRIAKTEKSTHNIFKLIDMHSAIDAVYHQYIEVVFSFESTSSVRSHADITLTKIRDSVSLLLKEFESQLQKHSSRTSTGGGIGVHALTKYAMIFISRLADNGAILSGIISDNPYPQKKLRLPEESYYNTSGISGDQYGKLLSLRFARLILVLLCNLDKKSETYKDDVALSYLFLTNNLNYVVEKVGQNVKLREILGEDWLSDHKHKVKQFAMKYQTVAWSKVVDCLPEKRTTRALEVEEVKECLKRFKVEFEETCRRQMTWIVEDGRLRDEMKVSIAKKVVGAYKEFYAENSYVLRYLGENEEGDDLRNYLSDLFYGVVGSWSSSTSPSSSSGSFSLTPFSSSDSLRPSSHYQWW